MNYLFEVTYYSDSEGAGIEENNAGIFDRWDLPDEKGKKELLEVIVAGLDYAKMERGLDAVCSIR